MSTDLSMLDLFRMEAEGQGQVLITGLLGLEQNHCTADHLESCMRAAHSLKGAARIVGLAVGVEVAHALEDCFVAAQEGRITVAQVQIDRMLPGVDLLMRIAQTHEADVALWDGPLKGEVDACIAALRDVVQQPVVTVPAAVPGPGRPASGPHAQSPASATASTAAHAPVMVLEAARPPIAIASQLVPLAPALPAAPMLAPVPASVAAATVTTVAAAPAAHQDGLAAEASDRVLRVTAESFNRLLGLASESLIKAQWVSPFSESLLKLKRLHQATSKSFDRVRERLPAGVSEDAQIALSEAQRQLSECQQLLAERVAALDSFDRRSVGVLQRLYDEALACRMRPFRDGTQALPLLVRNLARSLGKRVQFRIEGEGTQVDRDLLGKLDAPLSHLLTNALDHGIESPGERLASGKPEEGTLCLDARHSAGLLHITLSDDGRGVDLERLRTKIVERRLINHDAARILSEPELLEFLFLPGFTLKETVSDISGRGVGLDVVHDMMKQVRGTVRVTSQAGKGTQFRLQLPVTLSVLRALLVEVNGEPYAFPLSSIAIALQVAPERLARLEGRQHLDFNGRRVGVVSAHQLLGLTGPIAALDTLPIVVVGEGAQACGVIVDRFLGERELVVQPLDPLLGKIKDISAGALMDDGSPVLIIDVEDMLRSVAKLAADGRLTQTDRMAAAAVRKARKRVLVVDDSLTVRELERKLLNHHGYEVEVAVDGMDGWNAVRAGHFDLVVTDVDMPRMDGIELVSLITRDPNLKSTPVMIVSYKDRDEDRQRGLEAGASHYLTKGSFHDETLVQAVVDLIGEARA